jgi:hypothetical protein
MTSQLRLETECIDTDLLQAQSDPYRRMSANLYETKRPNEFYHIHGSLEASTTLRMLGLSASRPDLRAHEDIVKCIEMKVREFTIEELEVLNREHRQAGVPALKHEDFVQSPHVSPPLVTSIGLKFSGQNQSRTPAMDSGAA